MLALGNNVWTCKLAYPRITRENFASLSNAHVGKTVALIGWQVSCVTISLAEIARLGLPDANIRSSDGYNLLSVEKKYKKFAITENATNKKSRLWKRKCFNQ